MTTTRVAAHDRHLPAPDGGVRVVHVREHAREVPAWMFDTGPLPLLERPSDAELPVRPDPVDTWVPVEAPRCEHGSFARWAARNCCAPHSRLLVRSGDLTLTPPDGAGQPCAGRTAAGASCTRRTHRTDRHGRPACHDHGGHPADA